MANHYLSRRMSSVKPSGIRKFFDISSTMKDVISLGIGEPDFTTPEPILKAGIRALENGETHYTSNPGILPLRQALSAHLESLYGVSYDPENEIIITVGGSEALNLAAIALLDPGDEVIIPTPCFVSYQACVISAGGVAVEIPCKMENNFDVDPEEIRKAITPHTKAILIGFPNNPTGAVATRENLLKIAKIAEENDLVVLSDEIYDRLVYGVKHVCFPALPNMQKPAGASVMPAARLRSSRDCSACISSWSCALPLCRNMPRSRRCSTANPMYCQCWPSTTADASCWSTASTRSVCPPLILKALFTPSRTSKSPAWTMRPSATAS
jgi:aspartate/methionine/tyrosine aminotransferase